jgi:hypothetical protein
VSPPFVFSLEFELALGTDDPAYRLDRVGAFLVIGRLLRSLVPWLPDGGSGAFTPGFRYYLDSGAHWGCHENHAIRLPAMDLYRGMVPFLATRHLLTGNGRIDRLGRVLFSTRAPMMTQLSGGSTTSQRALFSTCRQEPLITSGPFTGRLHLICGDSLRSQLGEYLKVATTALVLAWLQRAPHAADDLWHPCPLRLLQTANVLWRPSGRLHISRTALRLQWSYWTRIVNFVQRTPDLPSWCGEAVTLWGQTLELLERDPIALTDRLDPFIKLSLFDAALRDMGRSWSDIEGDIKLYHRLALLDVAYHRVNADGPFTQLERAQTLHHRLLHGPLTPEDDDVGPAAVAVARRLTTRAAARAALITELCGTEQAMHSTCGWTGLWCHSPAGTYDLADPTRTAVPVMRAVPGRAGPEPPPDQPPDPRIPSLIERLRHLLVVHRV